MHPAGPIVLLCPPRSYSTVAVHMLGQHRQLWAMPENGLFFADSMDEWRGRYLDKPQFGQGAVRLVAAALLGGEDDGRLAAARGILRERTGYARDLLEEIAERVGPMVLVDKSPLELTPRAQLDRIARQWPSARFLHLTRHPYATIASTMRWSSSRPWATTSMAAMAPLMWWSAHSTASGLLADLPAERGARVRAEDVLSDPEGVLSQVLGLWGFDTDAESLAELSHPERAAITRSPELGGGDSRFLASPELEVPGAPPAAVLPSDAVSSPALTAAIAAMAREFGYDVGPG